MNKQQLASRIWALANELRGKVPAATYKDYMLGFLFYKYLSDREEIYLKEKLDYTEDDLDEVDEENDRVKNNCMNNVGYYISYKNLFSTWIRLDDDFSIENVTVALHAFERFVSPAYKRVFSGIFSTLSIRITDLGTTDPERTKNAKAIIKLVKSVPTDTSEDYDVLGFIYEFLLKNFAANAGKAGEFYTPYEASMIMAEIIAYNLKDKETISIYDPTSGSGSLLINIGQAVSRYLGEKNKVKYYAQELIPETYNLTRMNLIMRNILPSNIVARQGDTLDKDWPYFEENNPDETYDFLSVDACCSNPPYSQPWEPKNGPRFDSYGLAPKSKADYAFLLHNLYHLNSDGIMTIVLPHGVLFRGGEEGTIREQLIKKHNIETIIGLPANLFYGTGIPTIIMVLRKVRVSDDILFIDASRGFIKDGNKNKLRQRDVRKIVDTVIKRESIDHYSKLASFEDIENNGFNLNIPRYVEAQVNETTQDIYAMMYGGIPNKEIDSEELKVFWQHFSTLKTELFTPVDEDYSEIVNKNIKEVIKNNADVDGYIDSHKDRFSSLKEYLISQLIEKVDELHLESLEISIANVIKNMLGSDDLIDYYDCFEVLDTIWQIVLPDLEIVQTQGFEAAREIDDVKVLKKDSKTKKLEEKTIGRDGRLIPFSMIQRIYFNNMSTEVEELDSELSEYIAEKDELLDSIDPADKQELLKEDDSGDIVTKKLNAKISDIKKKIKMGAEYDDDSYESIIMRIDTVNTKIKNVKSKLKDKRQSLNDATEGKIKALTDSEIHDLLVRKWIDPICDGINNLSQVIIDRFAKDITELDKKYETTFVDIDNQINDFEASLSSMIEQLMGDAHDIQGLAQFNMLIGGDSE